MDGCFGELVVLAGCGKPGYVEGSGSEALFRNPFGLCLDLERNLIVADYMNNRVRRISPQVYWAFQSLAFVSMRAKRRNLIGHHNLHVFFKPSSLN